MKIMKTPIFAFIASISLTFFSSAQAENICEYVVNKHIEVVTASELEIKSIRPHSNAITAYEITLLQKNLTNRYLSLKKLLAIYENQAEGCSPSLGRATAIYDFSLVGNSVFADTHLRRVFKGFSKFNSYQLKDFVSNYKKYTANSYIEETLNLIIKENIELPKDIVLKTSDKDYDPNLYKISDRAINGASSTVAGVARVWGFISDKTMWREGRLKDNQAAKELLLKNLRPLDLIYETRNFTLSNYTIPGQWGHVGVWLGSKEELIALGVWDKEYFKAFREKVEAGFQIVEVRKEGINYQKLDTFINLDEIAITRIRNALDKAETIYSELTQQTMKTYDFKFDSRSLAKITCAELIAFSYGDIKWRETKTLFQYSLSPDDLAILSVEQPEVSEFVLFLKGQKDSTEFLNLGLDEWKAVLTAQKEKKALDQKKKAKEKEDRREREEFQALYR